MKMKGRERERENICPFAVGTWKLNYRVIFERGAGAEGENASSLAASVPNIGGTRWAHTKSIVSY